MRIKIRHLLIAMVPIALVAWVVAMSDRARTDARESQCEADMFYLGHVLCLYRDAHGRFPPAITLAADGTPMHSWRTVAFQSNLAGLGPGSSYDMTQPWDSPGNLAATAQYHPRNSFACDNTQDDHPRFTNFVAVVDRSGVSTLDLANATGPGLPPLAERILFIEWPKSTIPWTEPRDLAFEALDWLGTGHDPHGLGVIFADGSFRRVRRDRLIAMLRRQWPAQR